MPQAKQTVQDAGRREGEGPLAPVPASSRRLRLMAPTVPQPHPRLGTSEEGQGKGRVRGATRLRQSPMESRVRTEPTPASRSRERALASYLQSGAFPSDPAVRGLHKGTLHSVVTGLCLWLCPLPRPAAR